MIVKCDGWRIRSVQILYFNFSEAVVLLAKKKAKSKTAKTIPFEESFEQLKQFVSQLEDGNLTLTDSLETYERGVASLKQCYESLNAAQRRIELLVDLDEQGNLITRPFDNTSSTQMTEGTRRSVGELAVGDDDDEEYDVDEDLDEEFGEQDSDSSDSLF